VYGNGRLALALTVKRFSGSTMTPVSHKSDCADKGREIAAEGDQLRGRPEVKQRKWKDAAPYLEQKRSRGGGIRGRAEGCLVELSNLIQNNSIHQNFS
jgi:hypothetical protein